MLLRLFKSRIFRRYFLSYFVIFLIPFVVMSTIIYYQSVETLKTEINQSSMNKLTQVRNIVDGQLKEFGNIANRISNDPKLTPYMISHPYSQMIAIRDLYKYKINSSILNQLFLYYRGGDKIYSGTGMYHLDTLLNWSYQFNNSEKRQLIHKLNTLNRTESFPVNWAGTDEQPGNDLMVYLYPIPKNSPVKDGAVMFFVKKSVYAESIDKILGDFKGKVYIFNRKGREIVSASNGGSKMNSNDLSKLALGRPGTHTITLAGEKYVVARVKSKLNGWTFVTTMPTGQFFGRVLHIQMFVGLILLSLVFAGLLLTIIFAVRQYKPLSSLIEHMQSKGKKLTGKTKSIHETIDGLIKNHDMLQKQISIQGPFARDQYLLKLLKGDFEDSEKIDELCSIIKMEFPYPYFFVVHVSLESNLKAKKKRELYEALEFVREQNKVGYGVELLQGNTMAVIMNSRSEDFSEIKDLVRIMQKRSKEACGTEPTMAVSSLYGNLFQIHHAFIEALGATEYKMINGLGSIIYFNELSTFSEGDLWSSKDLYVKFTQGLKNGNEQVALDTLSKMFERMQEQHIPVHLLKCYCFDLINAVLRASADGETKPVSVDEIIEFSSLKDLERKIRQVIPELCKQVNVNKERGHRLLYDQLIQYIHGHYKDYELSLENIADRFGLSESYLSRFIKEQTGETFKKHLWQLRAGEVKKQLEKTNRPIKSIVNGVGYMDVASFTRKFKKTEGMTPGQYRKQIS